MIVGHLVEEACRDLAGRLNEGQGPSGVPDVCGAIRDWHVANPGQALLGTARYRKPPHVEWDEESYRGDAYGAYAWGTYVADVEVDLRTFVTRVRDFVAVQEIGKVLNETLARGQIQGGVVQAVGWALSEECKWRDGAMENAQLTNYVVPTAKDVPPIRVDFLEAPYPYGAKGAKGIGELPFDGPAPAVANAVATAVKCETNEIPITPERLLEWVLKP
jgi:CO/xanthine dehydrogenase Mo-binding subunit